MQHPVWRIFVLITLFFFAGNLLVINLKLFTDHDAFPIAAFTVNITPTSTPAPTPLPQQNLFCSNDCLKIIREATASIQIAKITPAPTTRIVVQAQPTITQVREFYIPLGTGTNSDDTWTDVPGAQVYIDSAQYNSIKSVTFEAAVNVPGHNEAVWVRLYNSSDNYIIGGSELYFADGNSANLQSTGGISLGSGNKLYKVQMKTQLRFPANLTNARVKISTY